MASDVVRVGNVEITQLTDGMLEFDLCNFFPTIPENDWADYQSHLTHEHKVRFNLGSYLIRADGRTILVDTGLGPRPAHLVDARPPVEPDRVERPTTRPAPSGTSARSRAFNRVLVDFLDSLPASAGPTSTRA